MALLITIAIRFLETIFAVGLIGSVFVLVLTMFEDFQELFGKEKTNHETGDYLPAGSKR
jgi:hypothetical protein